MAPILSPPTEDSSALDLRMCVGSNLHHVGSLPHAVVIQCDEALQADAWGSLPIALSELALFRERQGRK